MTVKANGRSLILATGLFVCFAVGPSQAATATDNATASSNSEDGGGAPIALSKYTKHSSRHAKSSAHRKSNSVAEKSAADKKPGDVAADNGANSSVIPSSVADANAQLASGETPTGDAAKAMSARANEILQNGPNQPAEAQVEGQVVSADQLNDVDRALHESKPTTLALASAEAPAAPAAPAAPVLAASNGESSTWDQTSLIGKIFIGFGALLTMASAARMFMA
jgi:hypothetical protein